MLIKNGRIVAPGRIFPAGILIEGPKFSKIGRISPSDSLGHEKIDATGLLIFPGLIDAHVHLRDPEATHKEDFYTGTCAALAGGFTTVLDMPNYRNPPTTTAEAYREKLSIAGSKAVCDFGLHMGATAGNFREIEKARPLSIKMFLSDTESPLTVSPATLSAHMKTFRKNRPILVHCESQDEIERAKDSNAKSHPQIRSLAAAIRGTRSAIEIAKSRSRSIHICHVSSAEEVSIARSHPLSTCEVAPHHLFLSQKEIRKLGNLSQTNPPVRSDAERGKLLSSLGKIDIIATDHAPHALFEKKQGMSGVPGLETALALLLDYSQKTGALSLPQIARMTSLAPARIFGLKSKGSIAPGFDADLCLVDPRCEWAVKNENLFTKCGWSPFAGRKLKGKVNAAIVRGQPAFRDGEIFAKKGSGRPVSY